MEAYIIAGISLALSVVVSVMGYLLKDKMETLTTKLETTAKELVNVQINYVQKGELNHIRTEILEAIEKLADKLDKVR